jgi:Protein of unknown function (DUF4232)
MAVGSGGLLIAGCSTGNTPAATPTTTVTVTAPASGQTSATSPATAPASTPAGPGPCQGTALKVALGPSNAGAGTAVMPIQFTNISSTPCTLYGFPGVSFTGETYAVQVGPAATRNLASPKQLVTLAPGAVASAQVKILNAQSYPPGACGLTTASGILVYPPNLTTSVGLPYNGFTCVHKYKIMSVDAVVAGPGT